MPKKNSKHLTDPGIAKISKAKKGARVERFDSGVPGLCLRVTDRGVKTWAVYYKFPGINRKGEPALLNQRLTIGQWPGVCVAEARTEARVVKDQAKAGVNPKEAREAANTAAGDEAADTFLQYCHRFCLSLIRRQRLGVERPTALGAPVADWQVPRQCLASVIGITINLIRSKYTA